MERLTQDSFIERAKKIHGDKYDYSKSVYKNTGTKITIICPEHGEFLQSPNKHTVRKQGCRKCALIKNGKNAAKPNKNNSLINHKEIILEWSNKNNLKPEDYCQNSGQKVWWTCKKCSKDWEAKICDRVTNKSGCAYCNGNWVAYERNRLSDSRQDLCEEWDYNKNVKYCPDTISAGSNKKIWWICNKCNESYESSVCNRVAGNGCPKCRTSKGERIIERYLKERDIEYKKQYSFHDCKNVRRLKFDFAIWINKKLTLIEFNGAQHYGKIHPIWGGQATNQSINNDKIKRQYCKDNNLNLLEIPYSKLKIISTVLDEWIKYVKAI